MALLSSFNLLLNGHFELTLSKQRPVAPADTSSIKFDLNHWPFSNAWRLIGTLLTSLPTAQLFVDFLTTRTRTRSSQALVLANFSLYTSLINLTRLEQQQKQSSSRSSLRRCCAQGGERQQTPRKEISIRQTNLQV